ncbi:polysaccharide pyruvyl transferase family protein [Candidatus Collinsella stercoripullorum]|uniref:polysaccharide pyruvyl transferase family protein n=1 Tax=Candidatus Collinsella stercoripullorum TaxID=2838522 RepID=UPI001C3A0057|nr:polysaccharide pyruvyl transferase family protein [Candidatus Collinsella stercoripullorum]HJA01526.1 polysaccharide pyruvyl transferase family protein [Candidatus Collinsella stercoripullorum]
MLKELLPVSSRSYHASTDLLLSMVKDMVERLERIEQEEMAQGDRLARLEGKASSFPAAYLIGEPGYPNYGDELIAREWLRYLARTHPDLPVYLDCARPGPAAAILRHEHPRLLLVDTVARLTFELQADELGAGEVEDNGKRRPSRAEQLGLSVTAALCDEGRAARYAEGIHILRSEMRGLHYLGGGYMTGAWQENLARLSVGPWAHDRGGVVIGTGLGFSPLDASSAEFALSCSRSFDSMSVRDESTLKLLSDNERVFLAPDDCFVNGLEGCYSSEDILPSVMVCIQGDLVEDVSALHSHVVEILKAWSVSKSETVGVVECNPYVDYPIIERLRMEGYSCRLFPTVYLLSEGFPARPGQRWITTRYHPHLLAAACGCKGIFIPLGSEYYWHKHAAVLRMGSRWPASPIGQDIPDAGEGFEDPEIKFEYQQTVRESAMALYGE